MFANAIRFNATDKEAWAYQGAMYMHNMMCGLLNPVAKFNERHIKRQERLEAMAKAEKAKQEAECKQQMVQIIDSSQDLLERAIRMAISLKDQDSSRKRKAPEPCVEEAPEHKSEITDQQERSESKQEADISYQILCHPQGIKRTKTLAKEEEEAARAWEYPLVLTKQQSFRLEPNNDGFIPPAFRSNDSYAWARPDLSPVDIGVMI